MPRPADSPTSCCTTVRGSGRRRRRLRPARVATAVRRPRVHVIDRTNVRTIDAETHRRTGRPGGGGPVVHLSQAGVCPRSSRCAARRRRPGSDGEAAVRGRQGPGRQRWRRARPRAAGRGGARRGARPQPSWGCGPGEWSRARCRVRPATSSTSSGCEDGEPGAEDLDPTVIDSSTERYRKDHSDDRAGAAVPEDRAAQLNRAPRRRRSRRHRTRDPARRACGSRRDRRPLPCGSPRSLGEAGIGLRVLEDEAGQQRAAESSRIPGTFHSHRRTRSRRRRGLRDGHRARRRRQFPACCRTRAVCVGPGAGHQPRTDRVPRRGRSRAPRRRRCIRSSAANTASKHRMTLDVMIRVDDRIVDRGWALNEASIENRSRLGVLEVVLEVDGRPVSSFGCDGVLVATPTGSTAYAFSAGGPVVWPELEALLVIPSNAHALFARPLVTSPESIIAVETVAGGHDGLVFCDGRRTLELPAGGRVEVVRGRHPVRWVRLDSAPFADRMVRKFELPVTGLAGKEALTMLAEIRIDNLGVISEASAQFHGGLTVLTGETGAGKTMVVTSLHLLSAVRAPTPARVRVGADRAVVEGRFTVDDGRQSRRTRSGPAARVAGAQARRGRQHHRRPHRGQRRTVPRSPRGTQRPGRCALRVHRPAAHRARAERPAAPAAPGRAACRAGSVRRQDDRLRCSTRYRKHRREWLDARAELHRTYRTVAGTGAGSRPVSSTRSTRSTRVAPEPGEDAGIVDDVRRLVRSRFAARGSDGRARGARRPATTPTVTKPAPHSTCWVRHARVIDGSDDPALRDLGPRLDDAIAVVTDVAGDLSGYLAGSSVRPGCARHPAHPAGRTEDPHPEVRGRRRRGARVGATAHVSDSRSLDVSADALDELAAEVDAEAAATAEAATALTAARHEGGGEARESGEQRTRRTGDGPGGARGAGPRTAGRGAQDSAPLTVGDRVLHAGDVRRRRGGVPACRAQRRSGSAAQQERVRRRALARDARARGGPRRLRAWRDHGLRRGRRRRRWPRRCRDRPSAGSAGPDPSGHRRHPPPAGRRVRRHAPGGGQGGRSRAGW